MIRNRTKRTITNILLRKGSSMLIGIMVVVLYGIPLKAGMTLSMIITCLTLIKDYFLDKHFNNKLVKELENKYGQKL